MSKHKLKHSWTIYAHLPNIVDWSINSYKKIMTIGTVEDMIAVSRGIPEKMVKNCMLFIMKKNINPTWEDKNNKNGGCFSYKILNKNVARAWSELTYRIVGNSISNEATFVKSVTGITISPKKNFCIIKIWMSNCNHQNPGVVVPVKGLQSQGCLFKKHTPEF